MAREKNSKTNGNDSDLNFDAQLWLAARSFSASNGEKLAQPDEVFWESGLRYRIPRNADSFRQDLHPDLKADFILAK